MGVLTSFLVWSYIALTVIAVFPVVLLLVVHNLLVRDRKRRLVDLSALWARLNFRMNPYWRLSVSGVSRIDRNEPYLVVANHQSLGDILVATHLPLRMRFVAKRELFWVPLWGWEAWLVGHLPIRRGDPTSRERLLADVKRVLGFGQSVLFFPEGTRSKTGEVGPFKSGAFHVALRTRTPILPLAIAGTRDALPKHSLRFRTRAYVRAEVLPPVRTDDLDPDDPEAAARLSTRVRDAIIERKPALDREVAEGLRRWHDLPRRPELLP